MEGAEEPGLAAAGEPGPEAVELAPEEAELAPEAAELAPEAAELAPVSAARELGEGTAESGELAHGPRTSHGRWLYIDNIFSKLHLPGDYEIFWIDADSSKDFSFFIRTERFSNIHLMHISVCNKCSKSFTIAISAGNEIRNDYNKMNNSMSQQSHLSSKKISCDFIDAPENTCNYLKTYCFSSYDVAQLKGKELLIPACIYENQKIGTMSTVANRVKASHKFGALLRNPILSDFAIESADGERLPAHKMILSAQSEVFKAMLKEDTAESQKNYVKLVDATKEDVECMLQFMYTGTVNRILTRDCRSLLMLADRFDLPGLFTLAQYALRRQINSDNALELAVIADMYNADVLESAIYKFVKENPKVLSSENWKELRDPDLMNKLFQSLLTNGEN